MAIYVGRWDCPACGTRMIPGPETRCPNCGASRPKDVQFYLPEDAERVEEEARLEEARAGVDWICGHCHTQNKARQTECRACGNPRDELSEDVGLEEKEYDLGAVPQSGARPRAQAAAQLPPKRSKAGRYILLVLAAIAGFFLLSRVPKTVEVEVSGFRWERSVQMEHFEPVQKEDWSLPSGAYKVSTFRAIHHYDKVFRGYETRYRDVRVKVGEESYVCGKIDRGNGYFEDKYCTRPIYETRREEYQAEVYDDVPVYRDKYRFTVDEWTRKPEYILRASGKDHQAQWPQRNYPDPDKWRAGPREGSYFVTVSESGGDTHEEEVGSQYWESLQSGQKLKAKKSWLFGSWFGLADEHKKQ